ncbi:MAG: peptidylprolyl isomerase [Calothrix sp. SM1_5_4]|nr:peptidylprolyl isomerase [Calothrix sp. SM1_5_4]
MTITAEKVVSIHYTLKDDSGEVLDSSAGADPLVYLHGTSSIIPGLEEALEGRRQGDKFNVKVPPAKAYGERNEKMVQRIPKDQFPDPERLQAGMQFQINSGQGPLVLTVVEVDGSDVTVDGNPPLAGVTLHFDVEVTDVRDATKEELAHGHAHGPGGHHHHE